MKPSKYSIAWLRQLANFINLLSPFMQAYDIFMLLNFSAYLRLYPTSTTILDDQLLMMRKLSFPIHLQIRYYLDILLCPQKTQTLPPICLTLEFILLSVLCVTAVGSLTQGALKNLSSIPQWNVFFIAKVKRSHHQRKRRALTG